MNNRYNEWDDYITFEEQKTARRRSVTESRSRHQDGKPLKARVAKRPRRRDWLQFDDEEEFLDLDVPVFERIAPRRRGDLSDA